VNASSFLCSVRGIARFAPAFPRYFLFSHSRDPAQSPSESQTDNNRLNPILNLSIVFDRALDGWQTLTRATDKSPIEQTK